MKPIMVKPVGVLLMLLVATCARGDNPEPGPLRKRGGPKVSLAASSSEPPVVPGFSGMSAAAEVETALRTLAEKEGQLDKDIQHTASEIAVTEARGRRLDKEKEIRATVATVERLEKEIDVDAQREQKLANALSAPKRYTDGRSFSFMWVLHVLFFLLALVAAAFVAFKMFTKPGATPPPLLSEGCELTTGDNLHEWYSN